MTQKLITIVGITGKQGSSVAKHFLTEPGWRIRGITRDIASAKAKAWVEKGVEIVTASLDDEASLTKAFKGSNAIFVVTDYASNVSRIQASPSLQARAREPGKSIEAYAGDLEIAQGLNAARAASHPEVLATLERYVFSTLPGISLISKGRYVHAYEFDAKAAVETRVRAEMPELASRMSTLAMGNYLENWTDVPALAPQREIDGSYAFLSLDWPGPVKTQALVWASEDTGAFVRSLVLSHPPGTRALGATAEVTTAEYAEVWSRVTGVKAREKVLGEREYVEYVPEEIREAFMDIVKFFAEEGMGAGLKGGEELAVKTRGLQEFVRSQDWKL